MMALLISQESIKCLTNNKKENATMTKKELEKIGTLIQESDRYDGSIYISTEKIWYYNNQLFASVEYSNTNRYSGKDFTHVCIDDVRKSLKEYNQLYWKTTGGVSEEALEKLKGVVYKEDSEAPEQPVYIGEKIRKDQGIPRTVLGRMANVPMRTIQNWEDGSRMPTDIPQLKRVANALGVKIDDLFDWK